jgi:hypothetical protein
MPSLDRLGENIRKIAWIEVIATFLITTIVLNPIIGYGIVGLMEVHAPGLAPPDIETDVFEATSTPNPGEDSIRYGIEWQEGYEEYTVNLHNDGQNGIENVELTVYFPGCIVTHDQPSVSDVDLKVSTPAGYNTVDGVEYRESSCMAEIHIDNLAGDDTAAVGFVINSSMTNESNRAVYYNPSQEAHVEFDWTKLGQRATEQRDIAVQTADSNSTAKSA